MLLKFDESNKFYLQLMSKQTSTQSTGQRRQLFKSERKQTADNGRNMVAGFLPNVQPQFELPGLQQFFTVKQGIVEQGSPPKALRPEFSLDPRQIGSKNKRNIVKSRHTLALSDASSPMDHLTISKQFTQNQESQSNQKPRIFKIPTDSERTSPEQQNGHLDLVKNGLRISQNYNEIYTAKDRSQVIDIMHKRFLQTQNATKKHKELNLNINANRLAQARQQMMYETVRSEMEPNLTDSPIKSLGKAKRKNERVGSLDKHRDYEYYQKAFSTQSQSQKAGQMVTKFRDVYEQQEFFSKFNSTPSKSRLNSNKMVVSLLDEKSKPHGTEHFLDIVRAQQRQKESANIQMTGKSEYDFPDAQKLKSLHDHDLAERKKKIAEILAPEADRQGLIQLVDLEIKNEGQKKKERETDSLQQYVKHYSATEDMVESEGARKILGSIGAKMDFLFKQNLIKTNLASFLKHTAMQSKKETHDDKQKFEENLTVFSMVFKDEKTSTQAIGKELLQRFQYQTKFKEKEFFIDKNVMGFDLDNDKMMKQVKMSNDPKVQYFLNCKKQLEVALPILDKVYNKTLCLQDYQLSQGHCKGIALACAYFDDKLVNRILFANNGMNGEQFADILQGLQNVQDIKSITYKQNGITQRSIDNMIPLFERKLPHQLEELRLIDIKASSSLIDDLVFKISLKSQISKLALVNCQQSERSFELVVKYVQESRFLKELDLSWCIVRQNSMLKLLNVIKENRQLTHLNLSWNNILGEYQTKLPIQFGKVQDQSNDQLHPKVLEVLVCFKEFIKYNANLIELDLSNTKLNNQAILFLCYCLRRASSLKTLHLCGNMSRPRYVREQTFADGESQTINMNDPISEVIQKVRKRLRAKEDDHLWFIKPFKTFLEDNPANQQIKDSKMKRGISLQSRGSQIASETEKDDQRRTSISPDRQEIVSALPRGMDKNLSLLQRKLSILTTEEKHAVGVSQQHAGQNTDKETWKILRSGLKLKNIMVSKRMQDQKCKATNFEEKKLIITRLLGFRQFINGSAQWQVLTKPKEECWMCGHWKFTIFIWTPRFGVLAETRNQQKVEYYKQKVKENEVQDFMENIFETPHIGGAFNNWRFEQMRNMIDFVMVNDPKPPDFLAEMVESKMLRATAKTEPLTVAEDEVLQKYKRNYYRESWPKLILHSIPFKRPAIANYECLSSLTDERTGDIEPYFYCCFVKPGLHDYVVRYTKFNVNRDQDLDTETKGITMPIVLGKLSMGLNFSKNLKTNILQQKREFNTDMYVHEFIAGHRTEEIPHFHKERIIVKQTVKKFEAKQVFNEFKDDTYEVLQQANASDSKIIEWQEVCNYEINDIKACEEKVKQMFGTILKKIFTYLQVKSRRYPRVDKQTLNDYFIKPAEISFRPWFGGDLDILFIESAYDGKDQEHGRALNRAQFTEFFLRLAKYLFAYSDHHPKRGQLVDRPYDKNNFNDIRVNTALTQMDKPLKRWQENIEKQQTQPELNRKYDLWQHQIELVYTMNEANIQHVFNFLCKNKMDAEDKPYSAEICAFSDLVWFFRDTIKYKLSTRQIRQCFGESKMTVINEQDKDAALKYNKLVYVEFLEFIARLALTLFEGTELEEKELNEKIELVLDEMFAFFNMKRVMQEIRIEEFSASDDDY